MIAEICISCSHKRQNHLPYGGKRNILVMPSLGEHWCEHCVGTVNSFHTFKLDNLSYIEEVAKERKLV